jgi:stage IV sporulation protein FB
MIFRTGYLTVGRFHGAPLRIHWTTPIGAYVFTGADYVPGAWLGFVLLVLAHEIGHAALVRAFRCRIVSIDIHGLGGECSWQGNAGEQQRATIAWGGILGQLVILVTTLLWAKSFDPANYPFVAQLVSAFTATNVMMMLLNLLPVRPLDGAEAWRLFRVGNLFRGSRNRDRQAQIKAIQRELYEIDRSAKEGRGKVSSPRETPKNKSMLN